MDELVPNGHEGSGDVAITRTGTVIADRYQIIEPLGTGSVGIVVKALDTQTDTTVAIKILSQEFADDQELKARSIQEGVIAKKLIHPGIVRVLDFGEMPDGRVFLVMEYISGGTLKALLAERRLGFDEALDLLCQIVRALAYTHGQGVIHRDLKPENILLTEDGEAKITDFGFARSLLTTERLTKTNQCIGTPIYISPEMIKGAEADHRTDIYSLGIMAYEFVEGSPPFYDLSYPKLAILHLQKPLPAFSPRPDGTTVRSWYFELVKRMTAKDPECRLSSVDHIITEIERQRSGVDVPRTGSGISPKALIAVALVTCVVFCLIAIFLL